MLFLRKVALQALNVLLNANVLKREGKQHEKQVEAETHKKKILNYVHDKAARVAVACMIITQLSERILKSQGKSVTCTIPSLHGLKRGRTRIKQGFAQAGLQRKCNNVTQQQQQRCIKRLTANSEFTTPLFGDFSLIINTKSPQTQNTSAGSANSPMLTAHAKPGPALKALHKHSDTWQVDKQDSPILQAVKLQRGLH